MLIHVEKEKLTIDGKPMTTADLTQQFLDSVVSKSLAGDVVFELEGEHPLVAFFQTIEKETGEGSALRQKMEEMQAAKEAADAAASDSESNADAEELDESDEGNTGLCK